MEVKSASADLHLLRADVVGLQVARVDLLRVDGVGDDLAGLQLSPPFTAAFTASRLLAYGLSSSPPAS